MAPPTPNGTVNPSPTLQRTSSLTPRGPRSLAVSGPLQRTASNASPPTSCRFPQSPSTSSRLYFASPTKKPRPDTRLVVLAVWVMVLSLTALRVWHSEQDAHLLASTRRAAPARASEALARASGDRVAASASAVHPPPLAKVPVVGRETAAGPYVQTRPITVEEDPRYDEIFDGARQLRKKLKYFVWQGENLCYDARAGALFTSRWYPGTQGRADDALLLPFPHGAPRDLALKEVDHWVEGLSLISMNYTLSQTGAHFYFWATPAFHMLVFAKLVLREPDVNLVFDDATVPQDHELETQLADLLFADVPQGRRLSRTRDFHGVTCFRRVVVNERVANPEVKMTFWPRDLAYLRKNVARIRSKEMKAHCKDLTGIQHKTIWLAQRRVATRRIDNIDELKDSIHRVFGEDWNVVEFDSVNSPCVVDSKTCLGYFSCADAKPGGPCPTAKSLDAEIELFNKISFLISVHGATAMNLPWMPDDSHFVEICPVGVTEPCYFDYSRRSPIEYYAFNEPNRTMYDTSFAKIPPEQCFGNSECRRMVKSWPVHVSVGLFEETLRQAKASYEQKCR